MEFLVALGMIVVFIGFGMMQEELKQKEQKSKQIKRKNEQNKYKEQREKSIKQRKLRKIINYRRCKK